jgi:hypothetical protein
MRTRTAFLVAALLVALSTVPSPARAGAGASRLALARYVALGFDTDHGFVGEVQAAPRGLLPDERHALEAVRRQLEQWGRYVITARPSDAEVLLAIRVGHSVAAGAHLLGPRARPGASGSGFGTQVSSGEDMLTVYDADGRTVLWQAWRKGGLEGSRPPLFEQLRSEVEAAAEKSAGAPD